MKKKKEKSKQRADSEVAFSFLAANVRNKNRIAAEEISSRKISEAELRKYKDQL